MIVLLVLTIGITLYLYSIKFLDAPISPSFRFGLLACRFVFLLLLLFLLTLPQIKEISRFRVKPSLYVSLDDSASMAYPVQPGKSAGKSRWQETLDQLQNNRIIQTLERKGFTIRYATLSSVTQNRQSAWVSNFPASVTPSSPMTDLSSVIDSFSEAVSSNEPAHLLLFTDGQWNKGSNPISAAAQLSSVTREVPHAVYTFGIGTTVSLLDIMLDSVQLPQKIRVGDPVQLRAKALIQGSPPTQPARIRVRGVDQDETQIVFLEQDIQFSSTESEKEVVFDLPALPTGTYLFETEVVPLPDEFITENNKISRSLQVREEIDRILLLTSTPDWELKYLKRVFEDQETFHIDSYLLDGNRLHRLGDREWLRNLTGEPMERPGFERLEFSSVEELNRSLALYPVIFLHNIRWQADQIQFAEAIRDFVSNGGGIVTIPGSNNKSALPESLRKVLPSPLTSLFDPVQNPVVPQVDASIENNVFLSLLEDPTKSDLPPLTNFYIMNPSISSGKPLMTGVSAMRHSIELVMLYRYGLGRIVIMGSNVFWKWKFLLERDVLTPFWMTVLYQSNPNIQMNANEIVLNGYLFHVLDAVEISYQLANLTQNATMTGVSLQVNGPVRDETLWLSPAGQNPNLFKAQYTPADPGVYRIFSSIGDASAEFRVEPSLIELKDLRQNINDLRVIAQMTNGEYANLPAWRELAERIPVTSDVRVEERSRFLGETWWMATLLIFFLCFEWYLRWRRGLP